MLQKLAALTTWLGTAMVIVNSISNLYKELEKVELENLNQPKKLIQPRIKELSNGDAVDQIEKSTNRGVDNNFPAKSGYCRICNSKGYTEWHHIISQHHARKTNQHRLIQNPGNVVELCKPCHNQTSASKSRYLFEKNSNRKTQRSNRKTNRFW